MALRRLPNTCFVFLLSSLILQKASCSEVRIIQPQFCQDNETLCNEMNSEMHRNARALLSLQQVPVLVLLMRFTDHVDRILPTPSEYEILFNSDATDNSSAPTGSLKSWLLANSYNQFSIDATVIDWQVTNDTEAVYANNNSGLSTFFAGSFYHILQNLENSDFDFTNFDANNDGYVDSFVVIHSGYAAEYGGEDCNTNATMLDRIWSHATSGMDWVSKKTGIATKTYMVSSGLRGMCDSKIARMSVIAHEFGHTLGLPDLIDSQNGWIGKGIGDWDLMANAHGRNANQMHPAHFSPWCKMKLGWVTPKEILYDDMYAITASETSADVYMISTPYPVGEYLLIENRQPILWDDLLWGGGLLIWHIDDSKDLQTERGYPGLKNWPGNNRHYQVALEQADGNYDLEVGVNMGDETDYFVAGKAYTVGPEDAVAQSSKYGLYPNSNSYQNGKIRRTGVKILDISASRMTMTFRVQGIASALPSVFPSINPSRTMSPTSFLSGLSTMLSTGAPIKPPMGYPTKFPSSTPLRDATTPPRIHQTKNPTPIPTNAPSNPDPTAAPTAFPTASSTAPTTTRFSTVSPTTPSILQTQSPTIRVNFWGNIFDIGGAMPTSVSLPTSAPSVTPAREAFQSIESLKDTPLIVTGTKANDRL